MCQCASSGPTDGRIISSMCINRIALFTGQKDLLLWSWLESDIAQIESLFQGRDGIAQREKLLAEIASVPSFQKSPNNGYIIDFLGFVNLVTSGIACGMIVCEIRMMLTNSADNIAFHNLHMID